MTDRLPHQLHQHLCHTILRPVLEATHGLRPVRQLAPLVSPALQQSLARTVAHVHDRTPIAGFGQLRIRVATGRRSLQFSGNYRTVDGLMLPVAGEIRTSPSTARTELVALETATVRHTQAGPRPITRHAAVSPAAAPTRRTR